MRTGTLEVTVMPLLRLNGGFWVPVFDRFAGRRLGEGSVPRSRTLVRLAYPRERPGSAQHLTFPILRSWPARGRGTLIHIPYVKGYITRDKLYAAFRNRSEA
jgi:hypothetical protein